MKDKVKEKEIVEYAKKYQVPTRVTVKVFGVTRQTIYKIYHRNGLSYLIKRGKPRGKTGPKDKKRKEIMQELREAGLTHQEIGEIFEITKQGVQQYLDYD